MDSEPVFVRPADVFASQFGSISKSPVSTVAANGFENDDKFVRYDSSPGSMISYSDESTFSPIEDDSSASNSNLLDSIKQSLLPHQDQFEPFSTFPIPLTPLEESLITTYLNDYAQTTYGFSSTLRPHPMTTVLSMSMSNTACFHLILARSAQFRLVWNKFYSSKEQNDLDLAVIKHKCAAIQMVRGMSRQHAQGKQLEELILSIIGLGTLDKCSGAADAASMHFGAVRRLVRSMGGPLHIRSVWLSRVLAHFESGYRTKTESYIYDRTDFGRLHMELNQFFSRMCPNRRTSAHFNDPFKRRSSADQVLTQTSIQSPCSPVGLKQGSVLFGCLSRRPEDPSQPTQRERHEMICQITCLLILCNIVKDHEAGPEALQSCIDSIHNLVDISQLQDQSSNNAMWLLQVHDNSELHSKRVWDAAGWVWILKHVNFNVQSMVRDWLIAVLTGKPVTRALKLDSFAFSYAS